MRGWCCSTASKPLSAGASCAAADPSTSCGQNSTAAGRDTSPVSKVAELEGSADRTTGSLGPVDSLLEAAELEGSADLAAEREGSAGSLDVGLTGTCPASCPPRS